MQRLAPIGLILMALSITACGQLDNGCFNCEQEPEPDAGKDVVDPGDANNVPPDVASDSTDIDTYIHTTLGGSCVPGWPCLVAGPMCGGGAAPPDGLVTTAPGTVFTGVSVGGNGMTHYAGGVVPVLAFEPSR